MSRKTVVDDMSRWRKSAGKVLRELKPKTKIEVKTKDKDSGKTDTIRKTTSE